MPTLAGRIAAALFSPQIIIAVVWAGMAALTVALVILMRTRWGQDRPLRKCVVLSLFAHVLFAAYATTIHIVRTHPGRGHGTAIRITAIDGHDAVDAKGTVDGHDGGRDVAPWDLATGAAAVEPQVPDLPPAEIFKPAVSPTTDDPALPEALAARIEQTREETPLPVTEVRPAAVLASPEPLEMATVKPQSVVTPVVGPQPAELELPADVESALAEKNGGNEELARLVSRIAPPPTGPAPVAAEQDGFPADEGEARRATPAPVDRSDAGLLVAVRPRAEGAADSGGAPQRPHTVPEIYRERSGPNRLRIAESYGGSGETEAAVKAALEWLAKHQAADGRWDASDHGAGRETHTLGQDRKGAGAQADTGLTGLALLAFLGGGHTHQAGDHEKTVAGGIDYLLASQAADGNLAGRAEVYAYMYCHGMATLALSEAYALTGDARLARPVRRAIAYTVAAQNLASGGWRYKPNERGDTSQLGWQLMALRSAELSGIAIPERTRQGIVRYLNTVSSGAHGGLAGYRPEERATHSMTAEALVCREFLGLSLAGAGNEAGDYLLTELPGTGPANFYYWYYGTLAMFQLQGDRWTRWNEAVSNVLMRSQRNDGDTSGSWDADPVWGGYGGRVFSTAMGTLCLEVYYRYLPLYGVTARREKSVK